MLIKNSHLLTTISEADKLLMDHAALEHAKYSNITFKIISFDEKAVTVQVAQGKSSAMNYQDRHRLIEIVRETFGRFFGSRKITVNAIPFQEAKCSVVNAEWMNRVMFDTKTKLKHIAEDTGINYANLSTYMQGHKEMPPTLKAMLYYYFRVKELEKGGAK